MESGPIKKCGECGLEKLVCLLCRCRASECPNTEHHHFECPDCIPPAELGAFK